MPLFGKVEPLFWVGQTLTEMLKDDVCLLQGGELHVRERRPVEKSGKPGDGQQVRVALFLRTQIELSVDGCVTPSVIITI